MTLYTLLLLSCRFFPPCGPCCSTLFMIFARLVLREHMFEGHVTFERNFQKIVKLEISSVTGCRYIYSLGSWLVVPGKHRGFSSEDRTLPMLWIHLEVDVPLHRTATFETLPFRTLLQFYYKTYYFYKQIETFVAPAQELELLRWLKPFLAPVRTKMTFAASAC